MSENTTIDAPMKSTVQSQEGSSPSVQKSSSPTSGSQTPSDGMKRKRLRSRRNKKRNTQPSSHHQKKVAKKPAAPPRPPKYEYVSKCCGALGRKPAAGKLVENISPESKRTEKVRKGLGHWRCSNCGKSCKVTPRIAKKEEPAPLATEAVNANTENPN